jgi:hypothetical protein
MEGRHAITDAERSAYAARGLEAKERGAYCGFRVSCQDCLGKDACRDCRNLTEGYCYYLTDRGLIWRTKDETQRQRRA